MNGLLLCARYAFAPNYHKYCGPDDNKRLKLYLKERFSDPTLSSYLQEFMVLYPYLRHIAESNTIADPFDSRVVHAYWVGNPLLENVKQKAFVDHLLYGQRLKDKVSKNALRWIIEKIPKGAKMHHSFHVFSVFSQVGHHTVTHTVDTMDSCRIGWGQILIRPKSKAQSTNIQVLSQRLVYKDGKLQFENNVIRSVLLPVDNGYTKDLKKGDWVTFHWGFVCDKITAEEIKHLKMYTLHNLKLANETL